MPETTTTAYSLVRQMFPLPVNANCNDLQTIITLISNTDFNKTQIVFYDNWPGAVSTLLQEYRNQLNALNCDDAGAPVPPPAYTTRGNNLPQQSDPGKAILIAAAIIFTLLILKNK